MIILKSIIRQFLVMVVYFLIIELYGIFSKSIILIGDSVDDNIIREWCHFHGSIRKLILWVNLDDKFRNVRDKNSWHEGIICIDLITNDSIAKIHLFGSYDVGPYHLNVHSMKPNSTINTITRVSYALNLYKAKFGHPDIVYLHTTLWDRGLSNDVYAKRVNISRSLDFLSTMDQFVYYTNKRIKQIKSIFNEHTLIGLRTAVSFKDDSSPKRRLLYNMNKEIKKISLLNQYDLFDYDKDVWSTVAFNRSLHKLCFRDNNHPNDFFAIKAGSKV